MASADESTRRGTAPSLKTSQSEQYVLNFSFDELHKLLMTGLLAYNTSQTGPDGQPGRYDRVLMDDASGGLKVAIVADSTGGGGGSGTGISLFAYVQKDTTSDLVNYKYYGYQSASGAWCVKRINRTTNLAEFAVSGVQTPAVSPDDYPTAWTGRTGLDYVDYATAF